MYAIYAEQLGWFGGVNVGVYGSPISRVWDISQGENTAAPFRENSKGSAPCGRRWRKIPYILACLENGVCRIG